MRVMILVALLSGIISATNNNDLLPHEQEILKQGTDDMTITDKSTQQPVFKKILSNGLTVLVRPTHVIPKVSLQIWYNVGSKDEKTGEKGLAHLLEHMVFKGTKKLSESDINDLTHKLSGVANAFTSYDYTGYRFDMPTQNWKDMLPIFADCMVNCTFKEDHLNSEMKAVIQELKMGRDNYTGTIVKDLLSAIFPDHPYHYPVIGYKQDLWHIHSEDLHKFYKKHYLPNNATLVIVGDVDANDAFAAAEEAFGKIQPDENYTKESFYWNDDIVAKSVTLYREVAQPACLFTWAVPGAKTKNYDLLDLLNFIIGSGKASRLQRRIVDEEQLATSLESFTWNLFDHALFFIYVEPSDLESVDQIKSIIQEELDSISKNGVEDTELERALSLAQMQFYSLLENSQQQAYALGETYLATQSEDYIFTIFKEPAEYYKQQIQKLCATHLRKTRMHSGYLHSLPESEKMQWSVMQQHSDEQDREFLAKRPRSTPVENAHYANTVIPGKPLNFDYPKASAQTLSNGLALLYYQDDILPKINIAISFEGKSFYDPIDKQGLCAMTMALLDEGTKKYNAAEFAQELESKGIEFQAYPGGISMSFLKQHLSVGLELLHEVLMDATFKPEEIEKIRAQMIAEIKNFWDEPNQFANQLLREQLYKGHPYSKNSIGSLESVQSITRDDIVSFYKKYINPYGTTMAVTGDFDNATLPQQLEDNLRDWKKHPIEAIVFPALNETVKTEVIYPINRDQVVLCMAALSVNRKHQDYDKLLLFDQIFGGGVLGSMASKLFQLREATGLFYTIQGSLISRATEQPGMVLIKTIVSLDRLVEAEKAILQTIDTVIDSITEVEIEDAKLALINSFVNNFESGAQTAQAFLFLHKYKFPADYFDTRAETINKITLEEVKEAARRILVRDRLLTLKIGRTTTQQP